MNTTKRFALGALALGLLLTLAALPGAWAQSGPQDAQAHMFQMRNIMHGATFDPQSTATGVIVTVSSTDPALAQAIQSEFLEESLQSPVEGSTVSAAAAGSGVALTFASEDAAVVTELQAYGSGLAYALLRNDMHAVMWGAQGTGGAGFGPGMMGPGYGPGSMGPGYGPGSMGRGYGPQGSAAQGSGPQGYGPGWMHGPGAQGYGPGMMGGVGRGMMGGNGPQGYGPGWGPNGTGPQGPAPEANPR